MNAGDAAARRISNSTAKAGGYLYSNTYNGMVNVTAKPGVPGYWINPGDNKPGGNSTPPVSPAPAIYTVVPKDSVDSISRLFGLSAANNYAHTGRSIPYSGHNGDWTNIWPGDKVSTLTGEIMNDIITSIIRTIVPMIVGAIVAFFATKGITFDDAISRQHDWRTAAYIQRAVLHHCQGA